MLGWTIEELGGKEALGLIHPQDHARAIEGWMAMLATRRPHQMRVRRLHKDGSWIWVDTTLHNYLGQPDRNYVLAEWIDVSAEMAAQEALAAREQLLDRLAQALPVGLFQVGTDRRVIYSNERLHEILGAPATEDLAELIESVAVEHRPIVEAALTAVLVSDHDVDIEVDLCLAGTGERRRCLVNSRALNGSDGAVSGAIVCVSDITESARMHLELEARALELEHKATFDVLTRCYNRGSTMSALDQALVEQGSGKIGVIFVDLDHFKPVNDLLGHAAGDELLVVVAERLSASMRGGDIVGRIGGDEFLVVCQHIDDPEDALIVARRITESLTQEIALTAGTIDLSASIGVACSEPGMTSDALVARADEAMYDSKRQGRGLPVLYIATQPPLSDNAKKPPRRRPTRRVNAVGTESGVQGEHRDLAVLMGIAEVADCLELTEQRVRNLALHESDFPKPVATVSSALLWSQDQIAAFGLKWPVDLRSEATKP